MRKIIVVYVIIIILFCIHWYLSLYQKNTKEFIEKTKTKKSSNDIVCNNVFHNNVSHIKKSNHLILPKPPKLANITKKNSQNNIAQPLFFIKSSPLTPKKKSRDIAERKYIVPYHFLYNLDTRYFLGSNSQLLNSNNKFDSYSFVQYIGDFIFKIDPYKKNNLDKKVSGKTTLRIKGNAGNVGRYLQTDKTGIKLGWSITETEHGHSINRLLIWVRELWLNCALTQDERRNIKIGFFPYALGSGITLGDAHHTQHPLPGQYTLYDVDQFRPGILLKGITSSNKWEYAFYTGLITSKSDNINETASYTNAQEINGKIPPVQKSFKNDIVSTAHISCMPHTKKINCKLHGYYLFDYNNHQTVEFYNDAKQKLSTIGFMGEWSHNRFSFSCECAHNFGSQTVKSWDRNVLYNSGNATFNSHIFYINPAGYTQTTYDALGTDDSVFSPAIGVTIPHALSRDYENGEIFNVSSSGTVTTLKYKNSYDRFRNEYKNYLHGWFLYANALYQRKKLQIGCISGIVSGDIPANDSYDFITASRLTPNLTYKDTSKTYKGFVGMQQIFYSPAVTAFYIHEAQKLQQPIFASSQMTYPEISNLIFLGLGFKYTTSLHEKTTRLDVNIIFYNQYKQTTKETNLPYHDVENLIFTDVQQADRLIKLDTYLGTELNASGSYNATQDLQAFFKMAFFIPGKYYTQALGKYIPLKQQIQFSRANISNIKDNRNDYNITLSNDTCVMLSLGCAYTFDSSHLFTQSNKRKHI